MSKLTIAMTAVVMLLAFPDKYIEAVEPLSSEEFSSHCVQYRAEPEGADGIFCVRYIQGFIDGAVATDERVSLNVAAQYDQEETLAQRAMRTRVGQQLARYGASYYAEFCLGAPVPLAEVVDHVVTRLDKINFKPQTALARDFVYQVLRDDYPCKSDIKSSN